MSKNESHRDLFVWQKAMDLTVQTYRLASLFPQNEIYRLTSQITRAAASVPANIAGSAKEVRLQMSKVSSPQRHREHRDGAEFSLLREALRLCGEEYFQAQDFQSQPYFFSTTILPKVMPVGRERITLIF